MVRNGNKYGMLSCLSKSWLFKIEPVNNGSHGNLFISGLIDRSFLYTELFHIFQFVKVDPSPGVFVEPLIANLPPSSGSGANGPSRKRNKNKSSSKKTQNKRSLGNSRTEGGYTHYQVK